MIEPTDEMLAAFLAAWDHENRVISESAGEYVEVGARDRAGLAAVLAIVERDLDLIAPRPVPSCGVRGPDGLTCERQPHPHGELHGWVRPGELVQW